MKWVSQSSNSIINVNTDIGNAKQGNKEGSKCCGEGEELSVSFENLKVICQACDDRLHATHLKETNQNGKIVRYFSE